LFSPDQWETTQSLIIQVCIVQMDRTDLVVITGGVVVNALIGITTGGVDGVFIFPLPQMAASPGLTDGI
jgi:hypothetical protein